MRVEQAELQILCQEIVDDTAAILGCALVDLHTGLPLAMDVKSNRVLNPQAMELISVAAANWFEEQAAGQAQPDSTVAEDPIQEAQVTTEDAYFYMSVVPEREWELMILVIDPTSTNLGLGWMWLRLALERLQVGDQAEAAVEADPGQPAQPLASVAQPLDSRPRQRATARRRRRTIWGQR